MVSYILWTQDVDNTTKHCQPVSQPVSQSVAITKFHAHTTQPYVHSSEVKLEGNGKCVARYTKLVHYPMLQHASWCGTIDCTVIRLYYDAASTSEGTRKRIIIGTSNNTR